jgi:hypothetical protein
MPFALYRNDVRVSQPFASEAELWLHVRESGLCAEAIENEGLPPRRVLNSDYLIYTCGSDGNRLDQNETPRPSWR